MSALQKMKTSPMWFVTPSLLVAIAIGLTIAGYSPLMFDPSLYQTQSALASELTSVDAAALESGNSAKVGSGAATDNLQDGTWTGYAACGEGNADDWKPYYVSVTIEVKDKKVTAITDISGSSTGNEGSAPLNWDAAENQKYLDQAISSVRPQMESQIAQSGAVSGIDTVSGATYSSTAIYNAYADAVGKAGGQVSAMAAAASSDSSGGESKTLDAQATTPSALADGSWTGYAACGQGNSDNWKPYYVAVTVRVKDGKATAITGIEGSSTGDVGDASLSWDASENQKYLSWAIEGRNGTVGVMSQINSVLSAGNDVSSVDTVSGATYSSEAIYNAYVSALNKSAKAAGNTTTQEPAKTTTSKTKKKSKTKSEQTVASTEDAEKLGALADGSWTAYAACGPDPDRDWSAYYVGVTITVKGNKVTSLDEVFGSSTGDAGAAKLKWDAAENQEYLDGAIAGAGGQIRSSLAAGKIPTSVDTVSGATYSTRSLFQAFYAALKKSAAAGGATVEEPKDDGSASEPSQEDPSAGEDPNGEDTPGGGEQGSDVDEGTTHYGYAYCESPGGDNWSPYYVFVEVKAVDGAVVGITDVFGDDVGLVDPYVLYSTSENGVYLNWAIDGKFGGTGYRMKSIVKQIQAKIDAQAAVSGIQTVSGATYSSKSIIEAYEMAAQNALAGVGLTPEDAVAYNGAPSDGPAVEEPSADDQGTGDVQDDGASDAGADRDGAGTDSDA